MGGGEEAGVERELLVAGSNDHQVHVRVVERRPVRKNERDLCANLPLASRV
jgi:hypothetical protein